MCANEQLSNPFEGQRWEQDMEHIIYLPKIFDELEKKQDLYLVGSRGTGKTTLLKALNWKTRVQNPSIHMQINEDELFEKKYIGIYIDVMSFGDSIFEINNTTDDWFMCLYSLWAEINVLYRLIEAIDGLYEKSYIDFTIEDEQLQCNKIYDYLSDLFGSTVLKKRNDTKIEYNLPLLQEVVDRLRSKVIKERENIKSRCVAYSFGSLIKETVPNLVGLCDEENKNEWYIKICFDQIESAPNFHKIANTLVVKKLNERVWFIVSGLNHRDIDMNQTYVPKHNLTNDDKKYIDLDDEFFLSDSAKRDKFYSLAEGICDLRLKHSDSAIDQNKKFKLATHLGSWDMNLVLDVFLKHKETTSVNEKFKEFMNLVRINHTEKRYLTEYPPYIDTYYYDILKNKKKWKGKLQKSRQKNSDTGKKYVVIMLALLKEYKLKTSTPYLGRLQIMSLCNSTRDFLKLMKALFDEREKHILSNDLNPFFSYEANYTAIEINLQTKAVLKVAEEKYNSIEHRYNEKKTERMRIFIDTCGNILYDLQAKKELSSLISDEKGIFTVSFKDNHNRDLSNFLKSADDDTYIKIINEKDENGITTIDFELSRLFAPKYKFSFRKPRNKINIDGEMLMNLCINKVDSLKQASKRLIDTVESTYELKVENKNKSSSQQKLFRSG